MDAADQGLDDVAALLEEGHEIAEIDDDEADAGKVEVDQLGARVVDGERAGGTAPAGHR